MSILTLEFFLNGRSERVDVASNLTVLDLLREYFQLTGAKRSCDVQVCGSCTVLVEGRAISACTALAADLHGKQVTTIEGISGRDGGLHPLQQAFVESGAVQCGFCTPGFILAAHEAMERGITDREALVEALSGNICRCTGYRKIMDAVLTTINANT